MEGEIEAARDGDEKETVDEGKACVAGVTLPASLPKLTWTPYNLVAGWLAGW